MDRDDRMNEPSITVVPPPEPAKENRAGISPELAFLLNGIDDEAQRNSIIAAFYDFSRGQPDGFAVRFAVLLQALTLTVKMTPERVKKAFGSEAKALQGVLIAYQTSLKESTLEIRQSLQVERRARGEESVQFNRRMEELSGQLEKLRGDLPDVAKAAAMIKKINERSLWGAMGLSWSLGALFVIVLRVVFHLF